MADDKTKQTWQDRDRVASEQAYELQYFADKHGISIGKARDLIDRFGNDREALDREASKFA